MTFAILFLLFFFLNQDTEVLPSHSWTELGLFPPFLFCFERQLMFFTTCYFILGVLAFLLGWGSCDPRALIILHGLSW